MPDIFEQDDANGVIVFLLGAGCSRHCGAPLMNEFMSTARRLYRDRGTPFKSDLDALFQFYNECVRISYAMDRWWENIEDLFTQAHLREIAGDQNGKSRRRAMERVIWDVYRRPIVDTSSFDYHLFCQFLNRLVNAWIELEAPRPIVITTNYDIHLENLLLATHVRSTFLDNDLPLKLDVIYPGIERPERGFCSQRGFLTPPPKLPGTRRDGGIELIKLHGSVNWFLKDGDDVHLAGG